MAMRRNAAGRFLGRRDGAFLRETTDPYGVSEPDMNDRAIACHHLRRVAVLCDDPDVAVTARAFLEAPDNAPERLCGLYGAAAMSLSTRLIAPDGSLDTETRDLAGQLWGELEFLLARNPAADRRHDFIVVIPVAERPEMLENLLESLLAHARLFGYGGLDRAAGGPGNLRRIRVVIADDSTKPLNRVRHAEAAQRYSVQGLPTDYFGLEEQGRLLSGFAPRQRVWLRRLVGDRRADGLAAPHKGAAVTRNLALLRLLREIPAERARRTLLWFIDSDEEFRVRLEGPDGRRETDLFSYFHTLDHLFSTRSIDVLTGRVVGDPPVAPAVMTNTVLDDVRAFVGRLRRGEPSDVCPFHDRGRQGQRAAVYHDLVELFGYRRPDRPAPFHCDATTPHRLADTAAATARDLPAFFHGRHPTREILFDPSDRLDRPAPARTVYTGNWVVRASLADAFIPFAHLNLRMAGPTLGRLLRARLGDRFVTANLPLLHRRTLPGQVKSEFRHGLSTDTGLVDISEQMVRQFWGDVLLFAVEDLLGPGRLEPARPDMAPDHRDIDRVVDGTVARMEGMYGGVRDEIRDKLDDLRDRLADRGAWWNRVGTEQARDFVRGMTAFLDSVTANFGPGSPGPSRLRESVAAGRQAARLKETIAHYPKERSLWHAAAEAARLPGPRASEKTA